MGSNFSDRLLDIKSSLDSFRGSVSVLNKSNEDISKKIEDANANIKSLVCDQGVLDRGMSVLKEFVKIVSEFGLNQYVELINKGLKTIFSDREYEFKVEVEDRGKSKRVFMLIRRVEDGEWTEWRNIDNSSAGTLRAVIDLITRVYLIVALGRRRFLIFDESLSQVSADYIDNVVEFLETISKEMGFDILFLTHDPRYAGQAKRTYEMIKGEAKLLQ